MVLATGYQPLAKTLLPTEDLRVRGAAHLATTKTCWMAAAAAAAAAAAQRGRQSRLLALLLLARHCLCQWNFMVLVNPMARCLAGACRFRGEPGPRRG